MTSRAYIGTHYGEERPVIGDPCIFLVGQREECPSTGKKHWQFYAEFNKSIRAKAAAKALNVEGAHMEPKRYGKGEWMANYCQKGRTKVEGTEFEEGKMSKQGERTDLQNVVDMIKNKKTIQEISEEHPETFIKFHRGIVALKESGETKRDWKMEVSIYWGKPGTGKTRKAYEDNKKSVFLKPLSKWWDGYEGQKTVIIDDFDPNTMDWSFDYLLRLLDRYPMRVEMKGSSTEFRSKKIIFTSNFNPDYWFQTKSNRDAFFRRIDEIKCFDV